MDKATDQILQYGILGAVFVLSIFIASKVIIRLYNGNEEKSKKLLEQEIKRNELSRADFIEMRNVARGEAFTAAEEGRKAIEANTKMLERIESILTDIIKTKI